MNKNANLQTIPLIEATQDSLCGGKATGLAHALGLGISVPNGFVVTDHAFQSFLEQKKLGIKINDLLTSLSDENVTALNNCSEAISDLVVNAPLPNGLIDTLIDQWNDSLSCSTLIVRSSAIGEDSLEASFAGQLESYLDIDTPEKLELALKRCWASFWSERSLAYQSLSGKQLQGMGVLIQCQVDSRLAGVLFTQPPMLDKSVKDDFMLGEYCFGQGVSLVSGQINPGRFRVFKKDLSWQKICDPEQPETPGSSSELNSQWMGPLANASVNLEEFHKQPQDIEWALDRSGELYIVQSRPIVLHSTSATTRPMITWTNANVRENFPDPITPLLYSVASAGYQSYFRNLGLALGISRKRVDAMRDLLQNIIGVHGARIYYNLSSIHSVIRIAPFGDKLIKYFNSFVGATETPKTNPGEHQFNDLEQNRVTQWLETIRIAAKTTWTFMFLEHRVRRFEDRADKFAAASTPTKLEHMNVVELRNCIRDFMDIRLHRWTDASLADAASMVSYGILCSLLRNTFPEEEHQALPNSLLKGVTGLVSSGPVFSLWELSRIIIQDNELLSLFRDNSDDTILEVLDDPDADENVANFSSAFNEYLEKWGFRCSGELMLTVPNFQENPAGLIKILKTYLDVNGESPDEVLVRQKVSRENLTDEVLENIAGNPDYGLFQRIGRRFLFKHVLSWTHTAISMRERARLKQALLYSRLRSLSLSTGEQFTRNKLLENADDIFFLTYHEIDGLASSRAMFPHSTPELIRLRRREHAHLSAMTPPDSFIMEEGSYLDEEAYSIDVSAASETDEDQVLEGTAACGGKVQGRATVLHNVAESDKLNAGDILITTQTDPGWGHVFFLIKGLIIERGGMLSHGAILAREFGIPAIVGVDNATVRIPQHGVVFLDGDRGQIRVLE